MSAPVRLVAALAAWMTLGAVGPGALWAGGFPPETPRGAPAVAGPTSSGARLVVFDSKQGLCGDVRRPREYASFGDCTRPTGRLRDPLLQTEFDGRGRRAWHWGFVAPEVAAVEVVMRGGLRVTVPTETGPSYTGRYAGRVRFFLVEARGERGQTPRYVKLLAADGSVLAVVAHFFDDPVRVGVPVELAGGGAGLAHWSLRAVRRRGRAPVPGNEERFIHYDCVDLRPERRRPLAEVCANPDFPRDLSAYSSEQACGAVGSVALGLVGPEVRAVRATLGDGRTRRLSLRPLPARYGTRRLFALVLGPHVAVRRIEAVERNGLRETLETGMPPGMVRCGDSGGLLVAYGEDRPEPTGPLAFTVYDDGVLLCATLGRVAPDGSGCRYPPLEDYGARILVRPADGRTLIAGVLPLQAVTAIVELDGGERRRLDATTDGSYSGRYRGLVRFFTLELPGNRRLRSVRTLDSEGRRLSVQWGDAELQRDRGPRVVLNGPGGFDLHGALWRSPAPGGDFPCVWLGRTGSAEQPNCGFPSSDFAQLSSTCTPRRLIVWGFLPAVTVRATVKTGRGPIRARVVRLPRFLWERRARAVFLAVIPPDAAPRGLVFARGGQQQRRRLRLPPAADQCGYETFVSTESGTVIR